MKTGQKTPGYRKADLATVSDTPEMTDAELARLRPAAEVLPREVLALLPRAKGGRPAKANKKVALTLRLDPDIVTAFKREGAGWQTRMNAALRKAVR